MTSERDKAHAFLEMYLGLSLVGQYRDVTVRALADLLATVRAEGVKAERAAVVAHMRKVTLPFREREEKTLHDMAGVIESGLFHVTPREAEKGKGS